jgi:DNA (cytosine-5)-methyltransferase 1
MTPTYGSLFSGVGGFDLGFDRAGYECRWQVEWDKHCQGVLARHWPDVPRWGDIQLLNGKDLPAADVVAFGSPCQDLSTAGKQHGLVGKRSSLFFEAARTIGEIQHGTARAFPRIAVWENVPGALRSNGGADFGVVLDTMAELGALVIQWAVLDARWFGVPQQRRRVFLVAVFDSRAAQQCPDQLLPVIYGRRGHSPTRHPKEQTISHTTTGNIGEPSEGRCIYAFDTQFGSNAAIFRDIAPTLKASQSAPTISYQEGTRRLTPRECERLNGWPDDHTRYLVTGQEQKPAQRYKQCGNGVASPVAEWIARQLLPLLA